MVATASLLKRTFVILQWGAKSPILNFWEHCSTNLQKRPFRHFSWWLDCTKCCILVNKPEPCLWLLCIVSTVYMSTHDNEPIRKRTSLVKNYMGQWANGLWLLNGKNDNSCCDLWFCEVMLSVKSVHKKILRVMVKLPCSIMADLPALVLCIAKATGLGYTTISLVWCSLCPPGHCWVAFLKPDSHREKVPWELDSRTHSRYPAILHSISLFELLFHWPLSCTKTSSSTLVLLKYIWYTRSRKHALSEYRRQGPQPFGEASGAHPLRNRPIGSMRIAPSRYIYDRPSTVNELLFIELIYLNISSG